MKKLLPAVLVTLTCMSGFARQLTADEALERLSSPANGPLKAVTVKPRVIATGTDNLYYVFATPTQTLFVSGDDAAPALLGYVEAPMSDLDSIPPTMRWWLGQYERQIRWASEHQAKAGSRDRAKTASRSASRAAIATQMTTQWDQGAPYNDLCPKKGVRVTYTGCVATAMAQVMKYHQYPAKGKGSNSYRWNNKTLSMNFATVTFDWDNMLDRYATANSGTAAQRTAVATLMQACGYSVNMEYGTDASGAYTSDMVTALIDNFDYDLGISLETRAYYSDEDWDQMMYDNLANVGPIIYGGSGTGGGHQFVIDGYRTDGYYHLNWGWNGDSDGYFLLDALDPESLGAGGGSGGFDYDQDAVLGVRKPVAGSERQKPFMATEGVLAGTASGRTVTLTCGSWDDGYGFCNMSPYGGTFDIGAIIVNKATGARTIVTSAANQAIDYYEGFESLTIAVPATLAAGEYTLTPAYRLAGGEWEPFKYYYYGGHESIDITVSASGVTVAAVPGEDPTDDIYVTAMQDPLPDFVQGQTTTFTATVENRGYSDLSVTLTPALVENMYGNYYLMAIGYDEIVEVPADGSVEQAFRLPVSKELAIGEYELWILDRDDYGMNTDDYIVKVTAASGVDDITAGDSDTPAVYYNLQGVRVDNPAPGQLVIRRRGTTATKIRIR